MAISASLVKELRERTGAGMMECKNALVETSGNIESAIELMRKKGQAKAAKKAGRIAAEGIIVIEKSDDGKSASILETNCETDFVARDDNFLEFVNRVAKLALEHKIANIASLSELTYAADQTVEEARKALVAKLGENINIRRVAYIRSNHEIASYLHGTRIGVLVNYQGQDSSVGRDLAMHIAASNPIVISSDQVSQEQIAKEKEIFVAQAKESGKPEDIINKMVEGRLKKYVNEVSLLGQPFVKDPSITIEKLLKQHNAKVEDFVRYEVGEGIEKETVNFAEEVMAQVKQS